MPNRADRGAWVWGTFVVLVLLVTSGLLVPGCGKHQTTIVTTDVETGQPGARDLQPILDRRAKAMRDGAEQAYLADLDPANQEVIQHERMVFANLRQFKLADFHFVVPDTMSGQVDPQKPGIYKFTPVIEVIQLTADAGPSGVEPGESFEYDLTKKNGKWVITGLVPLTWAEAAKRKISTDVFASAPWDLTPLHVMQVGDVWLAGDDSVGDLQLYANAAAAELGKVLSVWGDRARFPGYVLFFSRNIVNLRAWYDQGAWIEKHEALAIPMLGVRKNGSKYQGQYVGSRIVVNLGKLAMFGQDPGRVMRHELAHGVAARVTSVSSSLGGWLTGAPVWAVEGFARFIENVDSPSRQQDEREVLAQGVRTGKFSGQPALNKPFFDGDDFTVLFNYNVGSSMFRFVNQTKGQSVAVDFYTKVVAYKEVGDSFVETPAFDGICKRVLQTSGADFVQQWAGFVRSGG